MRLHPIDGPLDEQIWYPVTLMAARIAVLEYELRKGRAIAIIR